MAEWDRTRDWVLYATHVYHGEVTIRFAAASPSFTELVSLRRAFIRFHSLPVSELRAAIGESGSFSLRKMSAYDARQLAAAARREGLNIEVTQQMTVHYTAYDRATGLPLEVSEFDEEQLFAREMIAAGVPVVSRAEAD